MKKNLGYISLSYFMFRASFIGITTLCITTLAKQDSYITIFLSIIFGLLPILLFYSIANYRCDLSIVDKINLLFPKSWEIIRSLLGLSAFSLTLLNFGNLTNLIKTQFLNETPTLAIGIFLIFPIILLITKSNNIISRVSTILFFMSLILIITTYTGLINKIDVDNFKPFLEYNPTNGIIPFISYTILPSFMLLIFPNKNIKDSILKGFFISSISLIIYLILLISVLGIDLVLLFEYPEFHLLKLVYENFISFRLENFLTIQWILDIFIYTSVGLKFSNEMLGIEKKYILPLIMIILNTFLELVNSTFMIKLIIYIIPYVIPIFFLIIPLIIFIKEKKEYKFLKD